jgi:hypothetical protein
MPHKRVKPVSEGMMLDQRHNGHHTICATLREIFIASTDEEIKLKLRLAMAMAKKMNDKLFHYKQKELQEVQNNG